MSQLIEAVVRFNERKIALAGDRMPVGGACATDTEHEFRMLVSGYDLDAAEVLEVATISAVKGIAAIGDGVGDPLQVTRGLWVDALMTGLALADIRRPARRHPTRRQAA